MDVYQRLSWEQAGVLDERGGDEGEAGLMPCQFAGDIALGASVSHISKSGLAENAVSASAVGINRHRSGEGGMYELLIIACLAGQPARCDEFHIPFERPTGIMICLRDAQFRLSQWIVTMPGWDIKKWTCGLPRA